jgi:hypothetical protein
MLTIAILAVIAGIFAAAVCGVWRGLDPDYEERRRKWPSDSGGESGVPIISDGASSGSWWFGSSSSGGSDSGSCDAGVSDSGGACDAGGDGGGGGGGD